MENEARNAEIIRRRRAGVGPREIARQMGLSPNVVAGVVHRAGLCSEPLGRGNGAADEFRSIVLRSAEGLGVYVAARIWDVHPSSIYNWRRQDGASA